MKLFFFQIPYTLSSNLNVFDRLTIAKVIYRVIKKQITEA